MMPYSSISPLQQRDSCLALTFLLLLIWFFTRQIWLVYVSMAILLLGMVWPAAMKPFAWAWYNLALALGKVTSTILLSIIWAVLVLPVGLARRMMGKDPLHLGQWHDKKDSCFVSREHTYEKRDLEHPY